MSKEASEESAIVAGARAGAGAEEIVCVRDIAERDLSRNSKMDWEYHKIVRM